MRIVKLAAAVFGALAFAGAAQAATINLATNQVKSSYGGALQITFVGKEAVFSTVVISTSAGDVLFNNQTAAIGYTTTIAGPAKGADIPFQFNVLTSGQTLFSGLGVNNIDNIVHAILMQNADGSITVGFEDILGGGDLDFDDVVFTVTEVPLPGALALMATGLIGLGAARRRRKAA